MLHMMDQDHPYAEVPVSDKTSRLSKGSQCYVMGCHNYRNRLYSSKGISFHRFPNKIREPERYYAWVHNCRPVGTPSHNAIVCSDHFTTDLLDRTGQTGRLKDGAIPTLFQLPDSSQVEIADEQKPVKFPEVRIYLTDIFHCYGNNYNTPATSVSTPFHAVPNFPQAPVQPDNNFLFPRLTAGPGRGSRYRRFLVAALRRFPWAHYQRDKDRVFCYTCSLAIKKGVLTSFDKLRTARIQQMFTDDGFNHQESNIRALAAHNTNTSHLVCSEFLVKLACDLPRPVDQYGNPVEVKKPKMNSSKTVSAADNCGNIERKTVSFSAEVKPTEEQNAGEQEQISSTCNERSGSSDNSCVNNDLQGEPSPKKMDLGKEKQLLSSVESKSVSELKILERPSPFSVISDRFPMYSSEKYTVPSVYYLLYLIKSKHVINVLDTTFGKDCYKILADGMMEAGFTNFKSPEDCHELYQRVFQTYCSARKRYCIRLAQRGALDYRKVVRPRNPIYYKMVGWVTHHSKVISDLVSKHNLSDILIELDLMHAEDITEEDHKVIEGFYTGPAEELLIGGSGTSDIKNSGSRSEPASRSDTTHKKSVSTIDVKRKYPWDMANKIAPYGRGANMVNKTDRQSMRVRSVYSDPMVEDIRVQMNALTRQQKKIYMIGIQKIVTNILTKPTATNNTSSVASTSSNSDGIRTVS